VKLFTGSSLSIINLARKAAKPQSGRVQAGTAMLWQYRILVIAFWNGIFNRVGERLNRRKNAGDFGLFT
jgi:hypothetical protein